jgi:hypothetical protein
MTTRHLQLLQQPNEASDKKFLDRVRRDNMSGSRAFQNEGKTPGSVLCSLAFAQECALLDFIHIDDMLKNHNGRVGYP